MAKRVIVIVMDSVGVGALPDASAYGDEGSNTLLHVAEAHKPLGIPNLASLGLGRIVPLPGIADVRQPQGAFGKMTEVSKGKDTTTGHWEMMGVILDRPFPTYPNGFPEDLIAQFERSIGHRIIGNKVASGTEIMAEMGGEHVRTGCPIVYTSADSVFQIAAHEDVFGLDRLYEICRIAREMLTGEHAVARVIARPFTGNPGSFVRTKNRRDFSLEPINRTVMDALKEEGHKVFAVGKIEDIFAARGITGAVHTANNRESLQQTIAAMSDTDEGLIFTNCVDFDMLYGHRNDSAGYAKALEELDAFIPSVIGAMGPEDVLFITADHGCDPTTPSTDHSREYVPILAYGRPVGSGISLGVRQTFADLGATVADILGARWEGSGKSFRSEFRPGI